jgi:hypothetical protein
MTKIDYYSKKYHPQNTRQTWVFSVTLKKGCAYKSRILNPSYNKEKMQTYEGCTTWRTAFDIGDNPHPWAAYKKWMETFGFEVIEGHTDPYAYPMGKTLVAVGEEKNQWVKFTVWKK